MKCTRLQCSRYSIGVDVQGVYGTWQPLSAKYIMAPDFFPVATAALEIDALNQKERPYVPL